MTGGYHRRLPFSFCFFDVYTSLGESFLSRWRFGLKFRKATFVVFFNLQSSWCSRVFHLLFSIEFEMNKVLNQSLSLSFYFDPVRLYVRYFSSLFTWISFLKVSVSAFLKPLVAVMAEHLGWMKIKFDGSIEFYLKRIQKSWRLHSGPTKSLPSTRLMLPLMYFPVNQNLSAYVVTTLVKGNLIQVVWIRKILPLLNDLDSLSSGGGVDGKISDEETVAHLNNFQEWHVVSTLNKKIKTRVFLCLSKLVE